MNNLTDKIEAILARLATTSSDPKWLNDALDDALAEIKALGDASPAPAAAPAPQLNDALVETVFQALQDMEPADARALPSVINKNMKRAVNLSRLMTLIASAGVTSFNISRKITGEGATALGEVEAEGGVTDEVEAEGDLFSEETWQAMVDEEASDIDALLRDGEPTTGERT